MGKFYNCQEVAERYGVKILTVWDWIRKGKLSAIKIEKSYRVSEDDLQKFEKDRRTTNK